MNPSRIPVGACQAIPYKKIPFPGWHEALESCAARLARSLIILEVIEQTRFVPVILSIMRKYFLQDASKFYMVA